MKVIVGLGNPGPRYEGTRHNVGYAVVDELARRHSVRVTRVLRRALVGAGMVEGAKVLLVKPITFMNLSGEAVGGLARYYGVEPQHVWVVVDDAALPVGGLRLRMTGSSGGHRGLASVEAHLGTREYPRLRVGIGAGDGDDLVDHVLSRFNAVEQGLVREAVIRAADAIETALALGFEKAMSLFNRAQSGDDRRSERLAAMPPEDGGAG